MSRNSTLTAIIFFTVVILSPGRAYGQNIFSDTLTLNLKFGDYHQEVATLQRILNSDPKTRVSVAGPGSLGEETYYFGPGTLDAVIRFQNLHKNEVLTPLGITSGTGFVGIFTRKKLNELIHTTIINVPINQSGEVPISSSSIPVIEKITPDHGPNGTKITITGKNFAPMNDIITSYKPFRDIPSNDGETLQFTFDNPPFDALQKIENKNGKVGELNIPFYIYVVNENGTSTDPIIFTIQIRKK